MASGFTRAASTISGSGRKRPRHEQTLAKPKADRLDLLRASRAHFGQIFMLYSGAGKDFISGDRGNDTETGGSGADIFHSFAQAGIDKVLDFNYAQGDRVELDPGTTFALSQVGSDTIIDLGKGNEMIMVGVTLLIVIVFWVVS